jgi:hypothetical protein
VETTRITPEPDPSERLAILAALAAEADEQAVSEWVAALLPARDDEAEP